MRLREAEACLLSNKKVVQLIGVLSARLITTQRSWQCPCYILRFVLFNILCKRAMPLSTQHKPPGGPLEELDYLRRHITGPIVPMDYKLKEKVQWYDHTMQEWIPATVCDISNDQVEVEVDALEWNETLKKNEDVTYVYTVRNDQQQDIRRPPPIHGMFADRACQNPYFV